MDKKYGISDVSKLLQIPKHTIRFWDSEGLIRLDRNKDNDYREFSLPCVMEIGNIALFRGMDIPIKKIREMLQSKIEVQQDLLVESEEKIEMQMKKLEEQKSKIQMQKYLLSEIRRLQEGELRVANPSFDNLKVFENENEVHWNIMIEQPQRSAILVNYLSSQRFLYCIGCEEDQNNAVWRKNGSGTYVEFLLVSAAIDESRNNIREQLKKIDAQMDKLILVQEEAFEGSHKEIRRKCTGLIIGQYLASGFDGELVDYYKAWAEVE